MWQPPSPITYRGRVLSDLEAWVLTFSLAWEQLEHDPEDLDPRGFNSFGLAMARAHGTEDPAAVAARVYPNTGDYFDLLYPGFDEDDVQGPPADAAPVAPPAAQWIRVKDEDVPF